MQRSPKVRTKFIEFWMRAISLTQGQVALVHMDDYERINANGWFATWCPERRTFRAARWSPFVNGKRHVIWMHREVLGLSPDEPLQGDHIDQDTLNNCRNNLRVVTQSQNLMNRSKFRNKRSKYKGVSWKNREQKWYVRIFVDKRVITLGYFPPDQEDEAGKAYAEAAAKYHGEFRRLI